MGKCTSKLKETSPLDLIELMKSVTSDADKALNILVALWNRYDQLTSDEKKTVDVVVKEIENRKTNLAVE